MNDEDFYDDSSFDETPVHDPWFDIPNEAPNGAKYGWLDLNDTQYWDTVLYETVDGEKVEVSQVTDSKVSRLKNDDIVFVGFVTKFLRKAEMDSY